MQFRGDFPDREKLTMISARAGPVDGSRRRRSPTTASRSAGSADVDAVDVGGEPQAKVTLDVDRKFLHLIPKNVDASIKATTVFGNKYVAFSSPKNPSPQRITSADVIDVSSVTTEFNTLFETVVRSRSRSTRSSSTRP